jgi:NADPH2:quinone reductase
MVSESATEITQGDDISGVIHAVGEGVTEFKPGDRVIAFHEMMKPGGSYAEYAVAWAYVTAHLAPNVSFQEGAAVPLPALTSIVGLYARLGLPQPWLPRSDKDKALPLVIYGASSTIGYYAVQFALRSNIHPLICIAGRSSAHIEKLLDRSKGDTVIDYRSDSVDEKIKAALGNSDLLHAYDCIGNETSYQTTGKVMPRGATIALVMQGSEFKNLPDHIEHATVMVGDIHTELNDWDTSACDISPRA